MELAILNWWMYLCNVSDIIGYPME